MTNHPVFLFGGCLVIQLDSSASFPLDRAEESHYYMMQSVPTGQEWLGNDSPPSHTVIKEMMTTNSEKSWTLDHAWE